MEIPITSGTSKGNSGTTVVPMMFIVPDVSGLNPTQAWVPLL